MLQVHKLTGGYGVTPIVQDVSFQVDKGRVLGILGPNGSGKSTLLKMISGVLASQSGEVKVDGQEIGRYSTKQLARKMAVLPQLHANTFSNSVREAVSLGRYPHQSGFFSSWSDTDEEAVQKAMRQTSVAKYEQHKLEFLSGGEQQRVFIAQALAQQAELLLLDEPTNHLDIAHQKQILDMIRAEVVENGLTVVAIFHDINLASLYCDELLLMEQGCVIAHGLPHEVVLERQIAKVYDARVATYPHPELPKPQITMLPANESPQPVNFVSAEQFNITKDFIQLQAQGPLKVVSSAVHNAGIGWYEHLLNRSIEPAYNIAVVTEETQQFLAERGFAPTNTVVMLTAVPTRNVAINTYKSGDCSVVVMVTAGVGNSIDVTKTFERNNDFHIGTINTWVIINGKLTDEAFFQAMITATEAKTKALAEEDIRDTQTGTIATGTATDSLLIAATQSGEVMPYAGPITEVGKCIGRGVFETTVQAIQNYKNDKG